MSLTSPKFFAYFTIIYFLLIIINKISKNNREISKFVLLISSYLFIMFINYKFLLCILIFTIFTYFCSKQIEKACNKKKYLYIGIIFCVLMLIVFKYFNFFISSFSNLLGRETITIKLFLPVGISFYTFSAISYLVDIYNCNENVPTFIDYSLYISLFTKLTCGPIVKIKKFVNELNTMKISYKNFEIGIQIFVIGLFKKIVVADHLAIFVDDVFNYTNAFSSTSVFLAVITYSLLIYFDFSGYSEMAIGMSKILGFNFNNNFNLPYISKNPSEFWKRWHISLSSWLQEYLYIPLGGNRKGKIRTYINLFLTMLIGGLWHGANWTFIIWGAINGLALCIHKIYSSIRKKYFDFIKNNYIYKFICVFLTFIFITITWVFFRSDSINTAFNLLSRLITFKEGINVIYSWTIFGIFVLIIEIFLSKINKNNNNVFYPHLNFDNYFHLTLFLFFCGLTIIMAYVGETQFIYGNF